MEWEREQVKRRLSAELTELLRSAADALERLAPAQFETIGARALDLDRLMIHAAAAAALPAARLMMDTAPNLDSELYSTTDWAATGARLQSVAGRSIFPHEQAADRSHDGDARRMVFAAEEMLWRP
jgi:hypothetical protein